MIFGIFLGLVLPENVFPPNHHDIFDTSLYEKWIRGEDANDTLANHDGHDRVKRDSGLGTEHADYDAHLDPVIASTIRTFMNDHVFFIFLIPPIVFEAGFEMPRTDFFTNVREILVYAMISYS